MNTEESKFPCEDIKIFRPDWKGELEGKLPTLQLRVVKGFKQDGVNNVGINPDDAAALDINNGEIISVKVEAEYGHIGGNSEVFRVTIKPRLMSGMIAIMAKGRHELGIKIGDDVIVHKKNRYHPCRLDSPLVGLAFAELCNSHPKAKDRLVDLKIWSPNITSGYEIVSDLSILADLMFILKQYECDVSINIRPDGSIALDPGFLESSIARGDRDGKALLAICALSTDITVVAHFEYEDNSDDAEAWYTLDADANIYEVVISGESEGM